MPSSKRILVVGAGSIGLKHLRAFRAVGSELVKLAVVDPRPEARVRACETGAETLSTDWDSTDLSQFDGVVICAPPPLHVPYTMRCLEEGIPVLSEKPLSHSLRGVDELVEISQRAGSPPSGVAYVRRYHPLHEYVHSLIFNGEFGRVHVLRMNVGQPFATYRPDYRNIYYSSREQGGGCILDFASHFIDLAQWYMGPIDLIKGYASHLSLEGVEVEDTASLTFRFAGGALGSLNINQYQPLNENIIDLCGSESVVRIVEPGFSCSIWRNGAENWEELPTEQADYFDALKRQAAAFLNAIDGGQPMRTSIAEAAHTLKLCLDVLAE